MEDEGDRIEEVKCAKDSNAGFPSEKLDSLTSPLPPTLAPITSEPTHDEVFSTYSRTQRRLIVLSASCAGFFSPLATNIYLPVLNSIAADLAVSPSLINLTVTTYLVSRIPLSLSLTCNTSSQHSLHRFFKQYRLLSQEASLILPVVDLHVLFALSFSSPPISVWHSKQTTLRL